MKEWIKEIVIGINFLVSYVSFFLFFGGIILVIDAAFFAPPNYYGYLPLVSSIGGGLVFGLTKALGEGPLSP